MKMKYRSLALALLSAWSVGLLAAEEPAIVELRVLSSRIAHEIVLAAVQDCAKRDYKVSASVVDRNGNLSAFLRDPLSDPHTIEVSRRRAFTAATTQVSTRQLSSRPDLNFAPGMLLIVGGVPITASMVTSTEASRSPEPRLTWMRNARRRGSKPFPRPWIS